MVSALFRKEAWNEVGGYCETFPYFEDWDFWISLVEAGWGCVVIPEVLFEYRVRLNSMYQKAMRTSDKLGTVVAELVNRHPRSYAQYVAEIVGKLNAVIVEKDLTIEQERVEKAWLEGQVNNWQAKVQAVERSNTELEAWARTLEEAKRWLEEQKDNWQKRAEQRETQILELKAWIDQLEQKNHSLEARLGTQQEQRQSQERESDT